MENKIRERVQKALEANRAKDAEFAQKQADEKAEADLLARRRMDAKLLWPEFSLKAQQAATVINNEIAEGEFVFDVESKDSGDVQRFAASLRKGEANAGASVVLYAKGQGKIGVSFNGTSDLRLDDLDIFTVEQAKIEILLVSLFEHYVRGRQYQKGGAR